MNKLRRPKCSRGPVTPDGAQGTSAPQPPCGRCGLWGGAPVGKQPMASSPCLLPPPTFPRRKPLPLFPNSVTFRKQVISLLKAEQ